MAAAVEHLAVHREAFAGTHHHLVAEAQLGDRHLFLATVAQAHRALRAQRLEGADGAGGLALGAAFQVLAEEDQGDHHGGGFEVEVRHVAGRGGQPEVDAEAVAGAGAEGDQQVHIAGTGFHRAPGGDIEARADDELHRGRQEELRPRRQHPVQAGPFHQHRQHQRQRQQQRGDHPPAFAAQAALGIVLAWLPRVEQAGLVAGLFHRLQQGLAVHGAEQLEVGALAGQVDADLAYAGHLLQRPLDPADATGAGHALDGQFQAARRNLVAGLLDRRHQGRQAVRRGLHAGLLAGQVDRGGRDPGHFLQGSFDTAGAGRASHAADRQIELG